MIKKEAHIIIVLTILFLFCQVCYCQESQMQSENEKQNENKDEVYDDMSIDELLDVDVVVTASKKPEDLFDAPLSVTIVKKDKIEKAGCKTVMEALRLSPGLIVRESTPGNFDIHIRGYDDANKNFYVPIPYNSTILVMIDNRIVFSYFSGGTFWETLPVGVQDIERIEVVRGPASALYGPNAVNGVINIITSHAKERGFNTFVNASVGTQRGKILNLSLGYNWDDNTKLTFSTNMLSQNRFDRNYFSWATGNYLSQYDLPMIDNFIMDTITRQIWTNKAFMDSLHGYFDEDLSILKKSFNIFLTHNFSETIKMDVSLGTNSSESQKPGNMNFMTPLSQTKSESFIFDTRFKINNWTTQMNINVGHDSSNFGFNSYEYSIFDFSLEYNWQVFKSLNLRPGINVKGVDYSSPLTDSLVFNFANIGKYSEDHDDRSVSNSAFYFLTEWKPTKKLRFIAGLRSDTFDLYRTSDVNYEIASTYRINKNNLVRLVNSKASRAPFVFDTYLNCVSEKDTWINETRIPLKQYYSTTNQLKYPTNYTFEAGWRCKLDTNLNFDVEVYSSVLKNMLVSINQYQLDVIYRQDIGIINGSSVGNLVARNYYTTAYQNGLTFNINFNPTDKVSTNFFGSIQKTTIKAKGDYYLSRDTATYFDENTSNLHFTEKSQLNYTSWSPKSTPNFYGGFMINCKLNEKFNVNLNSYFYSKQYFINNLNMEEETKLVIDPWMDMNFKISYNPFSKFSVYATVNNLLGKHRELAAADNIVSSFWFGLQWGF